MTTALPIYPFEHQRCIGTICEVGPSSAKVNLPYAASLDGQWLYGNRLGAGEVGEFIIIESGDTGIFGRLVSIKLPERDRLSVEPGSGKHDAHPIGTAQLLTTIALKNGEVTGGIAQHPRLGSCVYAAHPLLLKWLAERTGSGNPTVVFELATLPSAGEIPVIFTPEQLFGHHCAILGATGGGKSWTIARILEQAMKQNAKVILFDATGEFHTLGSGVHNVYVGATSAPEALATEVVVPYFQLTEADLFALFKPSGQTQAPKLRAAMKSLKLAKVDPNLASEGVLVKVNKNRAAFESSNRTHATTLENPQADFDISNLVRQIDAECVWPTSQRDSSSWGGPDEQARSYCVTLLARIEDMLQSNEMACIFQPVGKRSLFTEIEQFLSRDNEPVMRISMKFLSFQQNVREIAANAVARSLLTLARQSRFESRPTLVILDEAHQFLNKSLGDESNRYALEAFGLIAKEGRKFCLTICIATQRPRDIPEDVLSQMGTLIVHRLTNDRDREVVERASGEIDRTAAAFLPTLAPGQAVIIGVDFPIPLTIQICKPQHEPDSRGPNYQTCWDASATSPSES